MHVKRVIANSKSSNRRAEMRLQRKSKNRGSLAVQESETYGTCSGEDDVIGGNDCGYEIEQAKNYCEK